MKKLLLATITTFAVFVANAAYLYWQVDDDVIDTYNSTQLTTPASSDSAYAGEGVYFRLRDSNGGSYGEAADNATYGVNGVVQNGYASADQSYYSSGVSDSFSYYVEMYNSDNWLIARSASINSSSGSDWNNGYSANLKTATLSQIPSVELWHVTGFTAVPEPTSAMLMLLGAAFLGLKRKNRSLA